MPEDLVILGVSIASIVGALIALGMIAFICICVLFSIIMLFFSTFSLMIAARMVNIKGRTFSKALTATFLIIFIGGFVTSMSFLFVPDLGVIPYFLSPCFFIKWIYECTFGKAVLASIYSSIISFLLAGILIITIVVVSILFFKDKFNKQNEKVTKMEIKEAKNEKGSRAELKENLPRNSIDNKSEVTKVVKNTPPSTFPSEKVIVKKASNNTRSTKSVPVAPSKKQKKKTTNSKFIKHQKNS